MKTLWTNTKKFFKSEDGPTATEYGVMLALIIVACLGTLAILGGHLNDSFTSTSDALEVAQ
ncbi:MAG TPA: Flp family type IVb pilin [Phycisphaerae bacterium]|nr:Flp family type IVb pilin [Phycisphaerae bacterium]